MICGHFPLVTVLTTLITTPVPGVPGLGQHGFTGVGGSNCQVVLHSTVLFVAQANEKGPLVGAVTTKFIVHWLPTPFGSVTVTVIGYVPGPTIPPGAGVWLHESGGGGWTVLLKQFVN